MGGYDEEFPLLSALGLYAADIRGDGNCLFNSLSDQIHGDQDQHPVIRARVIDYMRDHAEYYKQFLEIYPGGGVRRNPKRKTTGAYNSQVRLQPPSQEDIDRVFEQHLQVMAKGGTWGDNMEIQAFSSAYGIDVKIYQRDFAYMIQANSEDEVRPTAHIAYHTWEHYSSIRNLDGPHTGLPEVHVKPLTFEEELQQQEKLKQAPLIQPWMINNLQQSLPFLVDKQYAKKVLEECNGNLDRAVSKLLDSEDAASASSAQESSSIEREPDSDDDVVHAPNKRRDRKMSRASRHMLLPHVAGGHLAVMQHASDNDGSQSSLASFESDTLSSSEASQQSPHPAETVDTDTIVLNTSSEPAKRPIKIKIMPPKPPTDDEPQSNVARPARRLTARDKRDLKKKAQKAAHKEREQASARENASDRMKTGMELRSQGMTATPVIESGFRTLFI